MIIIDFIITIMIINPVIKLINIIITINRSLNSIL